MAAASVFSAELKLFGGLALAWLLGFGWFLIDHLQVVKLLPAGVLTGLLECLLEASIIVSLYRARGTLPREYRYFLYCFCILLPSDCSYISLHYLFRLETENWLTFLLTTLPYSAAYLLGCIGFYQHMRPRLANKRWMSFIWLPILLIVPAIFGILLPLLHAHHQANGWRFELFEISFNSIFAVTFFFWSTVTLIMSLDKVFPFVALGGIISQLGNWGGVSAYFLNKSTFTFSEYEFLWLCGIIAFWYSLVVVRGRIHEAQVQPSADASSLSEAEAARSRSLVVQQRMTIIGLISASLIFAVLLSSRDVWSYRIVFFGIALGSYIALLIGEILSKQVIYYATLFGRVVDLTGREESFHPQEQEIPSELWQVYQMAFHEDMMQHRMRAAVRQNLGELASQVAHDIRSPLVALDSVIKDTSQFPEEKRIIVRSAVGRIRDIANSLLDRHRETSGSPGAKPEDSSQPVPPSSFLLSSLIEPLITEKRLQYRSRSGVEIDSLMDESSYGIFANVQPVEFKRVVSNLIDNAVEAARESRKLLILVNLVAQGERILVRVEDNGRGIPAELLAKIGNRGESHGKEHGCGLGLYHARASVEAWGGQLDIASEIGKGTTVTIALPQAPSPDWFVSELRLAPGQTVVILDDDTSIHQVWQGRMEALRPAAGSLKIEHCTTPEDLRRWVLENVEQALNAVYLIDYELLGYAENGLALAGELKIGEKTILVTSRFEEPAILEECRRLGARMIPKPLAGLVPIRIDRISPQQCDAVLIDDDPLVRMTWQLAARDAGKRLRIFSSAAEFFREAPTIDRRTPLYVDQELGDGLKGDQAAARMSELGFEEIYLATGHAAPHGLELRHIKAVVGKEPPWSREGVVP